MPRWDSRLNDLMLMQERMTRLFEESLQRSKAEDGAGTLWSPAVDIFETDEEVVLIAELPGIERDDVRVDVEGARLSLRGERRFSGDRERYHRVERPYGAFSRSFDLPPTVDPDRISADYRRGLLTVRLPKAEASAARRVEITVE
jgi:HSP20 family protein